MVSSGIQLDKDFDMVVDQSGDVGAVNGQDLLETDLAVAVTTVLTSGSMESLGGAYNDVQIPAPIQRRVDPETGTVVESGGVVGAYIDDRLTGDIELLVANIIDADPRIQGVTRVEATTDARSGELTVEADVLRESLKAIDALEFTIQLG